MNRDDCEKRSTDELKECFVWIDEIAHPKRVLMLLSSIAERENMPLDFLTHEDITKNHSTTIALGVSSNGIFSRDLFYFEQYSREGLAVKEKLARLLK